MVGRAVLADFFDRHVGQMAQMEDLVADLAVRVPAQAQAVEAIAADWLGAQACPLDTASLCPG